tara:strand:- start:32 stop:661 length:630 start_codon:yes stop_codon:yes gene_type:complete
MFHFRIATHGKVAPSTCHPFVSTTSKRILKLRNTKTRLPVVSHNGIISNMGSGKDNYYSDTMLFIRNYLSKVNTGLHLKSIRNLIELGIDHSKLVIMTLDDTYYIGSSFVTDDDFKGWVFSNSSYGKSYAKQIQGSLNQSEFAFNQGSYQYSGWSECDGCGSNELDSDLIDASEFSNGNEWYMCKACVDTWGDSSPSTSKKNTSRYHMY